MRIPSLITACLLAGTSLSACQTSSTKGTAPVPIRQPAEIPPEAPKLPRDYRRILGERLLDGFMADGAGRAEISAPYYGRTLFGSEVSVVARFPVRAAYSARVNPFINPNGPNRMRCIVMTGSQLWTETKRITPAIGQAGLADTEECGDGLVYTPFKELELYAERMKVCGDKGKSACLPTPDFIPGQPVTRYF
ncbi:hypothetical protein [Methylobacterium oryzihabitans]|uniref:Lipoprotein n=1 Tax=Methylobacterium oryzihabitans TaxID=2499852 RepID=A0A437PEH7_9HYPH|nr:hypothetical protein [Methylobacterium oryzihabitans]RVU20686.1 hypothetical protein EOE48_04885 [Methylobacterium oryzihabitans]